MSGLHNAVGHLREEPAIIHLLDAMGPWEIKSYKSSGKLPACQYYTCKEKGVQLCFEQASGNEERTASSTVIAGQSDGWKLAAAHLYNENVEGFRRFQGDLGFGLTFDLNNAEVRDKRCGGGIYS